MPESGTAHTSTPAAARCAGLTKSFGKVTAVNGLDLEVRIGECFGLLGQRRR
jgi:ABC-type multidrug transport system ATPase subunit